MDEWHQEDQRSRVSQTLEAVMENIKSISNTVYNILNNNDTKVLNPHELHVHVHVHVHVYVHVHHHHTHSTQMRWITECKQHLNISTFQATFQQSKHINNHNSQNFHISHFSTVWHTAVNSHLHVAMYVNFVLNNIQVATTSGFTVQPCAKA